MVQLLPFSILFPLNWIWQKYHVHEDTGVFVEGRGGRGRGRRLPRNYRLRSESHSIVLAVKIWVIPQKWAVNEANSPFFSGRRSVKNAQVEAERISGICSAFIGSFHQ